MPIFLCRNEYLIFQKITKLEFTFPEGFPLVPKDLVEKLIVSFYQLIRVEIN